MPTSAKVWVKTESRINSNFRNLNFLYFPREFSNHLCDLSFLVFKFLKLLHYIYSTLANFVLL